MRQHIRRERRISRIARRTRVHQVAAAVARREDFFANAIHFFRHRDRIAAFRRRNRRRQSRCTAADDQNASHNLHNGAQKLTPRAIELIHELTQKGVHFVAASGRQYDNERRLFSEIKDEISYIGENGSICIHQGKVISRGIIADDLAAERQREFFRWQILAGIS